MHIEEKDLLYIDEIKKRLNEKGVPFDRFLEAIRSGEITPVVKNSDTGKMEKFIVDHIDNESGEVYGRFLDD